MKKLVTRIRGFTLIETLVAVTLLTVSIVAPMTLVSQSLRSAFYARDQIAAYNLAQEGIEAVRAVRDGNVLNNALFNSNVDLLASIPIGQDFVIDARESTAADAIEICATNPCQRMRTNGTLYGYEPSWTVTNFTRTLRARYVDALENEIRIEVTVSWPTASMQTRSFTIHENMYRWIEDGSAAQ